MSCSHPPADPGDPVGVDVTGLPELGERLRDALAGGAPHGAVAVLLDVDGERVDRILIDGGHDLAAQLDRAIDSLRRARQTIRRLQG